MRRVAMVIVAAAVAAGALGGCGHGTAPANPAGFPVKVVLVIDESGSMCVSDPPGSVAPCPQPPSVPTATAATAITILTRPICLPPQ